MKRALASSKMGLSFKRMVLACSFVSGAVVAAACGDSGDTTDGTGASSSSSCKTVKNGEFCAAQVTEEPDCEVGQTHALCGVKLTAPTAELARSTSVKEFSGSGAPKTSCYEPATYPPAPGMSQSVTVEGLVKIFSNGCNSKNVKMTFYKVIRDGSESDGKLGEAIGTPITTDADCTDIGVRSENKQCNEEGRWECRFSYANVPTDVELAVKTENGDGSLDWSPLIQYNVYVPSAQVTAGKFEKDFRAIDAGDYQLIAVTAIGGQIKAGNGAIGGEIHDCDDVRLLNAVADIDKDRVKVAYFTSDEEKPLPKPGATQTEALGLYAILDVPPGQVRVAAAGLVGSDVVSLGEHNVYVYPDTVTSLTFRGMQPYQLPK